MTSFSTRPVTRTFPATATSRPAQDARDDGVAAQDDEVSGPDLPVRHDRRRLGQARRRGGEKDEEDRGEEREAPGHRWPRLNPDGDGGRDGPAQAPERQAQRDGHGAGQRADDEDASRGDRLGRASRPVREERKGRDEGRGGASEGDGDELCPDRDRRRGTEAPEGGQGQREAPAEEAEPDPGRHPPVRRAGHLPGRERPAGEDPVREIRRQLVSGRDRNQLVQKHFELPVAFGVDRVRGASVSSAFFVIVPLSLYGALRQKISEGLPGPKKLVLDGPQGHSLQLGDFLVRELPVVPKADQLPVVVGEPFDGEVERLPKAGPRERLEGVRLPVYRVDPPAVRLLVRRQLEGTARILRRRRWSIAAFPAIRKAQVEKRYRGS